MNIIGYMLLGLLGGPVLVVALAYAWAFPLTALAIVAGLVAIPIVAGIFSGLGIAAEAKRPEPADERAARADKAARDLLRP